MRPVFARLATAVTVIAFAEIAPGPTASTVTAQPAVATENASSRIASYDIEARLDPAARTIKGIQTLTWRNATSVAASSLQFHLYYNAWRNTNSTWMREQHLAVDLRSRHALHRHGDELDVGKLLRDSRQQLHREMGLLSWKLAGMLLLQTGLVATLTKLP